jgi:hypothetical protein
MTLAASGTISASDLRTEFVGGSGAVDMASYYRGANTNVRSNAANNTATNLAADVPTSGAISFNDFYSQAKGWQKTFSSNATQQSGTGIFGDDYAVDYPKTIIVNAGVTVYSTASGTPAIDLATGGSGTITVTNNGNIYGQGGAASSDGGTALKADVAITLNNNSGANLKGGGGGGGTGGTGGKGVYTANATFTSVVDEGGGGTSSPQNNIPSWFTTYSGDLDGRGVVSDRLWQGLNRQFPRGIGQPTQFQVRHTSGAGNGISGNCANRGPIYFSGQTNTTGVYTVSASISSQYGSGYGTPTISVSESTSSAGTSVSNSGTAGINASTTTYFTIYGTTAHQGTTAPNFYYNSLSGSVSGTCLATQAGGSGGSGGVGQGFAQSAGSGSGGSSGSNNAGNGGTGGVGGSLGASGSTGATGSNGSGTSVSFPATAPTNGTSGSSGGSAGYYILGQSNVSLTNNGAVAGRIG